MRPYNKTWPANPLNDDDDDDDHDHDDDDDVDDDDDDDDDDDLIYFWPKTPGACPTRI